MENTTQTEAPAAHPFTLAGLGQAPFRFVGMVKQDLLYGEAIINRAEYQKTGIAITTKAGGSCAYCGTYILNMFQIQSADGKLFHVGSDCVEKTCGPKLVASVKRMVSKLTSEKRAAREIVKISEGEAFLARADVAAFMASTPSPAEWRAKLGDTLANYVAFAWSRSGVAGKLRQVSLVRSAFEAAGGAV